MSVDHDVTDAKAKDEIEFRNGQLDVLAVERVQLYTQIRSLTAIIEIFASRSSEETAALQAMRKEVSILKKTVERLLTPVG